MKIGIVGFQHSGKTTLFNALTGQQAPIGPSGNKINLGTIKVPDARVDRLAEIDDPRKTTYAEVTFADVPGGRGEKSLSPETLGRIREMDSLVQVVRGFDAGMGIPKPVSDLSSFEAELILADMQVAEKRIERLEKDHTSPTELKLLYRCLEALSDERSLRDIGLEESEKTALSGFAFLSLKPLLVVLSREESAAAEPLPDDVVAVAGKRGLQIMPLSGPIEAEIAALEPEEQRDFLADLGLNEAASARFLKAAYSTLDLITFLTHGPDECRAWPIKRGSPAVEAARAVHSDIARGFIRAEVIHFDDFDRLGSEAACRDAGKLRIEGRDYVVLDGDICHFRFNV